MKPIKKKLFLLTLLAYTLAYICRLNLTAAMPEMIDNELFGSDTASKLGIITSVYFICYGVGQFFSGILADFFHSVWMLFIGLFLSACCNVFLYFFHTSFAFYLIWGLNGLFQSMIWPPILKIYVDYYTKEEQITNLTNISVAMPAGTLLGYFLSLIILSNFPWNNVFLFCGLLNGCLTTGMIWCMLMYCRKLSKNESSSKVKIKETKKVFRTMFLSSFVFLFIPVAIHGALKDGMSSWTPSFLKSNFSISTQFSLCLTMIVPLFNMFGAYLAKQLYKKLQNLYQTACYFFAVSTFALLLLFYVKEKNIYISTALIVLITTLMYSANYIFISILPLSFSKYRLVGTASGLLNSIAYLGSALSCFFLGRLIDLKGWNFVVLFWLCLSIVAFFLLLIFSFRFKKIDR